MIPTLDDLAHLRAAALDCLRGNPNSLQVDVATAAIERLVALAERAALVDAVREVRRLPALYLRKQHGRWVPWDGDRDVPVAASMGGMLVVTGFDTELAAWQAALEAGQAARGPVDTRGVGDGGGEGTTRGVPDAE